MTRKPPLPSKQRVPTSKLLRLVIGLGNPGLEYAQTRHNAGFLALDAIARTQECTFRRPLFHRYQSANIVRDGGVSVMLLKPLTFMNRSGEVIPRVQRRFGIDVTDIVVICDQLDLPTGTVRIKRGGGTGGHRGLRSLVAELGNDAFVRVYVGVDKPIGREAVVNHVLGVPEGEEAVRFFQGIETARDATLRIIDTSIEEAMNEYNRRGTGAS